MKSQCLLLPRIKTATTGYTNCLRLYNTTICAARKEETTQRASHICTYMYIYLLMCMCAADASNSKSGGCLPDSPTDDDDDDPLHGCGVSDKNINQAVSLMCLLAPVQAVLIGFIWPERPLTNGPHCLRLIPDAINPC